MADRFDRLLHDAVIGGHDQHHDVGDIGAPRTHCREGLMAWRIDEGDLLAAPQIDPVSADVLRDTAGLARRNVSFADRVEQRGLAVIDVAHHCDHRRTCDFDLADVLLSEQRFERFVRHLVFEADDAGICDKLPRNIFYQLRIERLVHGHEHTAHQQRGDQVLAAHSELLSQILDADALRHRDGARDGQRLLRNLRSTETRWRRKALHRAFLGLWVLLASTAARRTARTLRTRCFTRRRN